jgi:hypothetical protein
MMIHYKIIAYYHRRSLFTLCSSNSHPCVNESSCSAWAWRWG